MYINDLPGDLGNEVITELFADEVEISPICGGWDGHCQMLVVANRAERWGNRWQLVWSVTKSVWMIAGDLPVDLAPIVIYGQDLAKVVEVEYLGVLLSSDGKWVHHWLRVKKKAERISNSIMRFGGVLQVSPLFVIEMVRSIIRAIFFYGSPVWAPFDFDWVDRCMAKVISRVMSLPWNCGVAVVLAEAGMLPSRVYWEYLCITTCRRISKNMDNPTRDVIMRGMARSDREWSNAIPGDEVGLVLRGLEQSWGVIGKEGVVVRRKAADMGKRYWVRKGISKNFLLLNTSLVRPSLYLALDRKSVAL